jgi:regulator of protease activity HflC (stomatin/prohibitin superfamily)
MPVETILIIIAAVVLLLVLVLINIRIVPQAHAFVIERLWAYHKTWSVGLHVKVPLVDKVSAKVSLKEDFLDFPPQPVITKDNVTIMIDTVVFYQITDPKLYTYGITDPKLAIANLSATTLRNIIGDLELDQTLTSRDLINTKMRTILDEATDAWGIKVNRVELKNINPPIEIQNAMERQMKAERERRESILRAEGEKRSQILVAEGEKQSAILRAEASKEKKIREAEGEAEAILKINTATAEGLKLIKGVNADNGLIAIKSLEALEKVADGKATKLIIPSEIQSLAGLAASLKEIIDTKETIDNKGTTE